MRDLVGFRHGESENHAEDDADYERDRPDAVPVGEIVPAAGGGGGNGGGGGFEGEGSGHCLSGESGGGDLYRCWCTVTEGRHA